MKKIIIGIIIGAIIALVVVEFFKIYKDLDKKMITNFNVEKKESNIEQDESSVKKKKSTVDDTIFLK